MKHNPDTPENTVLDLLGEAQAALKSKNFIVCCECLDMAKREVEKLK